MARNKEKQYGSLNRLILMREKEEYEKANPKRPRLETLDTAEEVQKWLPSIKRDIEFYLKKSEVICYSEDQIQDCRVKVSKLENEFKAFVRKITQLTPGTLESIPWTNRPYKRKYKDTSDISAIREFVPIDTPILNEEKPSMEVAVKTVHLPLMNKPLNFISNEEQHLVEGLKEKSFLNENCEDFLEKNKNLCNCEDSELFLCQKKINCLKANAASTASESVKFPYEIKCTELHKISSERSASIVNYDDSSDNDDSS